MERIQQAVIFVCYGVIKMQTFCWNEFSAAKVEWRTWCLSLNQYTEHLFVNLHTMCGSERPCAWQYGGRAEEPAIEMHAHHPRPLVWRHMLTSDHLDWGVERRLGATSIFWNQVSNQAVTLLFIWNSSVGSALWLRFRSPSWKLPLLLDKVKALPTLLVLPQRSNPKKAFSHTGLCIAFERYTHVG